MFRVLGSIFAISIPGDANCVGDRSNRKVGKYCEGCTISLASHNLSLCYFHVTFLGAGNGMSRRDRRNEGLKVVKAKDDFWQHEMHGSVACWVGTCKNH